MRLKKQFVVSIIFMLFGGLTFAQCLPTDTDCTRAQAKLQAEKPYEGFDPSLELPPQLYSESSQNDAEVVMASDWFEQNSHVFIPSGAPSWGAVAKDGNLQGLSGLGVSDNWITQYDAAMSAIELCQKNGGQDCQVQLTYSNACLAIAVNKENQAYWKQGVTKEIATQAAMQTCVDNKQGLCQLAYARCSYPSK